MSEEGECPICHMQMIMPTAIPACSHKFCFLCLKGASIQRGSVCPLCRGPIDNGLFARPSRSDLSPLELADPENNVETIEEKSFWLYKGYNGWWRFDPRTEHDLQVAFQSQLPTVELSICGSTFVIDFGLMVQYRKDAGLQKRRFIKHVNQSDMGNLIIKGVAGVHTS